jgi:CubicO group peptidase (beta-lactamase class C family)
LKAAVPFLLSSALFAQTDLPANFAATADSFLRRLHDNGAFMGTVLVRSGESTVFLRSYGTADAKSKAVLRNSSRYQMAALASLFSAVSILQLEKSGRLRLADSIAKLYTEAPGSWAPITIEMLLRHQSGLPDSSKRREFDPTKATTPLKILADLHNLPLAFPPGSGSSICDTNSVLLGLLVERASGQSLHGYIDEKILNPLSLKDTGPLRHGSPVERRAVGYGGDTLRLLAGPAIEPTAGYALSDMYGTVEDMARFVASLENGKILPLTVFDDLFIPGPDDTLWGVFSIMRHQHRGYFIAGSLPHEASSVMRIPGQKLTVVVYSNLGGINVFAIAAQLADHALGEPLKIPNPFPPVIKLTAVWKEALLGRYEVPDAFRFELIEDEGGLLYVREGVSLPRPLYPLNETTLVMKTQPLTLIVPGLKGKVEQLRVRGQGKEYLAQRVN